MTLRLSIVSDQRHTLGEQGSIKIGPAGASIGRSAENDWMLPDPQRYVSACHARISFRDGQYFFEDVSTNGSFVNDAEQPLAKHRLHRLQNGDLLRLGGYRIAVALEAEAGAPHVEDDIMPFEAPAHVSVVRTQASPPPTDIDAFLDINDLLITDEAKPGSAPRPVPGPPSLLSDEPVDAVVQRRLARLAKAVERQPRNGAGGAALLDTQNALQAFCRGAGIDPALLPPEVQARFMLLVGQLLREALVGLKDLDRSRNEIRNRFRIDMPAETDDPRPSLSRLTVDDLILTLFNQHELRSIDAVQWLREAINAAKEHESGVVHAMRAAFVEFLDRIDPAELEARFERAARRGNAKSSDRSQYWQLYTEFYRSLIEMPADRMPHTFLEAFARAYLEKLKKSL